MSFIPRKFLPAGVVILAAALVTVPALAAPDKTGTLNMETLEFKWTGGPHSSAEVPLVTGCGDPGVSCEYILLKLEAGGDLTVRIEPSTPSDLDLYFYRANAAGEPQGAALKSSAESPADSIPEEIKAPGLAPGDYVAEVVFFAAAQTSYDGVAKLANPVAPPSNTAQGTATATATVAATPPRATPTPTASPAPDHVVLPPPAKSSSTKKSSKKKKKTARQKCLAKAKKIKNAKKRKAARKKCTKKKKKRS